MQSVYKIVNVVLRLVDSDRCTRQSLALHGLDVNPANFSLIKAFNNLDSLYYNQDKENIFIFTVKINVRFTYTLAAAGYTG